VNTPPLYPIGYCGQAPSDAALASKEWLAEGTGTSSGLPAMSPLREEEVPAAAPAVVAMVPPPEPAAAAEPAPPAPAPAAVLTGDRIEIHHVVQFEANSDVLRPDSEATLGEVAGILAAHPEIAKVIVEGHTDTSGRAAKNVSLSARRAQAVREWLVTRGGVVAPRLDAKGYGSSRPVASNDTSAGRVLNRRIDFVVVR
jgi:outer membrane protein OmpA-like peptidoglycan-associated protein